MDTQNEPTCGAKEETCCWTERPLTGPGIIAIGDEIIDDGEAETLGLKPATSLCELRRRTLHEYSHARENSGTRRSRWDHWKSSAADELQGNRQAMMSRLMNGSLFLAFAFLLCACSMTEPNIGADGGGDGHAARGTLRLYLPLSP
jgi:hypothetical protein